MNFKVFSLVLFFNSISSPVPLKKDAAAGAGPNERRPARGGPVATAPLRGALYPGSFGGRAAGADRVQPHDAEIHGAGLPRWHRQLRLQR